MIGMREPARWRDVAVGFTVAAAAVGAAATAYSGSGWFGFQLFLGALAHAWVLGIPLYLVLRDTERVTWWSVALAGFITGALPVALSTFAHLYDPAAAAIGGDDRIFGVFPLTVSSYALLVTAFGLGGAAAALVFWLTVGAIQAIPRSKPQLPPTGAKAISLLWALGFFFALLPLYAVRNFVIHDASCHNAFRDRAFFDDRVRAIAPRDGVRVMVTTSEWPRLQEAMRTYAAEKSLHFIDRSTGPDPDYMQVYTSACDDSGIQVTMLGTWSPMAPRDPAFDGVSIDVFETREGAAWRERMAEIRQLVDQRWPGRVRARTP